MPVRGRLEQVAAIDDARFAAELPGWHLVGPHSTVRPGIGQLRIGMRDRMRRNVELRAGVTVDADDVAVVRTQRTDPQIVVHVEAWKPGRRPGARIFRRNQQRQIDDTRLANSRREGIPGQGETSERSRVAKECNGRGRGNECQRADEPERHVRRAISQGFAPGAKARDAVNRNRRHGRRNPLRQNDFCRTRGRDRCESPGTDSIEFRGGMRSKHRARTGSLIFPSDLVEKINLAEKSSRISLRPSVSLQADTTDGLAGPAHAALRQIDPSGILVAV